MLKSLKMKFTVGFIALALLSMLVSGVYLIKVLDDYFIGNLQDKLLVEAKLVREMVIDEFGSLNRSSDIEKITGDLGNVTSTRVTVIDANGVVLGDSEQLPTLMENHLRRPEIQQAISEGLGIAERESTTLNTQMMYLALPVEKDGEIKGFVRLALPMTEITTALSKLWSMLFIALLMATVIAGVLGFKLSQRLTKPIQEMTAAAQNIADGDFSLRTYTTGQDEIGKLGQALNQMAQQLKEMIDEVSTGKSKLETVLANMVSGVIFLREDGKIDLINPAALKILEIEPKNVNRHQIEIINNYQLSTLIDTALKTHKAAKDDLLILSPHEKNIEVNITPILGKGNTNIGAVMVLHDITDLRKLETMRRDFVANVSHELKTPVTSLKGYAETLLDGALDDPETAREFVRIILTESERLRMLVDDLLELSRIESGKDPVEWQKIDVSALLHSLEVKLRPQLEARQIELTVVCSEKLPYAWGDYTMIEQVLTNLTDNAIKYSAIGEKVKIVASEKSDGILFEVIDSGPGIPEHDLPRVFERFYRVDKGRNRKQGGTGLGLAIVKHILETHSAGIQVESTLGRGSRFYFMLTKKS
ncbi:MAG: cell wall metabolism sensor histidine kinase WalK [Dehalobacter sp. 4CP]|uniref:two-component system histidine kinase PnpS n=1 Tax=Dehalobacter sp. CP TaxID=2594474 RepID=UPI0013CC0BA8|nr:cell wall metabolism sensor histidine kinase WalK [Dehalobacter sp. 4CP]